MVEDIGSLLEALENQRFLLPQDRDKHAIAIGVRYDDQDFKVEIRTNTVGIREVVVSVTPTFDLKHYTPFPKDLTQLESVSVRYNFEDLTKEVIAELRRISSRDVTWQEVVRVPVFMEKPHKPRWSRIRRSAINTPTLSVTYVLQKPDAKYTKCAAAVDWGEINPKYLPRHMWQETEGHFCLVENGEPFPIIFYDLKNMQSNLALNFRFMGGKNGEKRPGDSRISELLDGLPLVNNSQICFSSNKHTSHVIMALYEREQQGREKYRAGEGRFSIGCYAETLEEGVSRVLPVFLRFYEAFKA